MRRTQSMDPIMERVLLERWMTLGLVALAWTYLLTRMVLTVAYHVRRTITEPKTEDGECDGGSPPMEARRHSLV